MDNTTLLDTTDRAALPVADVARWVGILGGRVPRPTRTLRYIAWLLRRTLQWFPKADMSRRKSETALVAADRIEHCILSLRGQRVMLDSELAALYGIETRTLVQAVRRNRERFPDDFMFQLTAQEVTALRSQPVISNTTRRGGRRYAPYAFTEQGVAMLSSVLRSPRAVAVNVEIIRTFVRLRRILAEHADLSRRLDELEKKYDHQFKAVFDAIRGLMQPPATPPREMGYHTLGKAD